MTTAKHSISQRRARLLASALVLLTGHAPVSAGVKSLNVDFLQPPSNIVVEHDGTKYSHLANQTITYRLGVDVECGHNESSLLVAGAPAQTLEVHVDSSLGLEPWASCFGPCDLGNWTVGVDELFVQPFSPSPVERCNNAVDQRIAAGESRAEVLSSGLEILYMHTAAVAAKCYGPNDPQEATSGVWPAGIQGMVKATAQAPAAIVCKAGRPARRPATISGPAVTVRFQVTKATLACHPAQQTVVCPADLHCTGTIAANGPGAVKYRVEHNGGLGPQNTLAFAKAGVEVIDFDLEIGGSEGPQIKGGGGQGGGLGDIVQNPQPANKLTGTLRLKIDEPAAGPNYSSSSPYSVTCKDSVTVGAAQSPSARGPAAGGRVAARPGQTAGCPYDILAMCKVGKTWKNCCEVWKSLGPRSSSSGAASSLRVADRACVERCNARTRDRHTREACYERCGSEGGGL